MSIDSEKSPLITVLLPVYNAMPFLPAALQCLLNQTETRITVLAINDGSSDESEKYLNSVQDSRLTVVHRSHRGLVPTLNYGLTRVETPYVGRMDADDLCDLTRFSRQLAFLAKHPDCVLVGCSADHIGTHPGHRGWRLNMPTEHSEIIAAMVQRKSAIIHPTILVRTDVFGAVGFYSEEVVAAEEQDLFFRIGLEGRLANLPENLYSIRLHKSSITANMIRTGQTHFDTVRRKYRQIYFPESARNNSDENKASSWDSFVLHADIWAVYFYRRAITAFCNRGVAQGVFFLILAMILSPWRSFEYLKRRIKAFKKSGESVSSRINLVREGLGP